MLGTNLGADLSHPAYLRPGDVVTASIATDDGVVDLGRQRTPIVAP